MSDKQHEALFIADVFDSFKACGHADEHGRPLHHVAAAELRRLHALNAELVEALGGMTAMWVSVCNPRGWEPDHMAQHIKARAALSKANES